jgi:hypothetical protein
MEQSSNSIAEQTGFNKQRVMRALTKIRLVMINDVPKIFFGTVEVDETYLGGQWKTNEDPYVIRDLNDDEVQRSNQYLGSSVMVWSGPRLWKTLEQMLFNP